MTLPSIRLTNLLLASASLVLILIALFMQYQMDLPPCPLCISQRVAFITAGTFCFIAFLHAPKQWGHRVYAGLSALILAGGAALASRQLWLQSLPEDQVPACGPSIEYMISNFPLSEALSVLLQGDGNCAEVVWTFLGLSIPGWTLVAFIGLILINIWQMLRKPA
ncbi:MAG: disulfide bond formation protein B [Cellvibrionaceae bacterium]